MHFIKVKNSVDEIVIINIKYIVQMKEAYEGASFIYMAHSSVVCVKSSVEELWDMIELATRVVPRPTLSSIGHHS